MNQPSSKEVDIVVIGGGQSGLALGYFLRRTGRSFVILDAGAQPGGAWNQGWDSLRLFSPAEASSLPGWPMPQPSGTYDTGEFPSRQQVVDYLAAYEARYKLPIERPVRVERVRATQNGYEIETDRGTWQTKAVVSTTGTATHPFVPPYPGLTDYTGLQLHSARYRSPDGLAGQRVLIVGGGNSGAQILAEVSRVAQTVWVTLTEPMFLPDAVDGRVLFSRATERYKTLQTGEIPTPAGNLGDIVMVPSVREARSRGVLHAVRPFVGFTQTSVQWADGRSEAFDTIIWCTGFRPATDYLRPLGIVDADGRIATEGTRATQLQGLWLVGYGAWTGFASATLIGVGRSARATADEINTYLQQLTPAFTAHN
ncbi:ArsO family NAD(P)H-dependent flavin-containing monooxygenase [Spirosoma spitsbergense]|uniref:ArsO family NAD(P)H-dependent flavin-containing monooxygenase n=1 Tax=Spirosoma spitsbergense TaxID=431554 RepID=UPI000375A1E0|nr:ArsO family NAD(P)H-dependent flavin-containing monooxygenase [Spirosoma spitsbergense]